MQDDFSVWSRKISSWPSTAMGRFSTGMVVQSRWKIFQVKSGDWNQGVEGHSPQEKIWKIESRKCPFPAHPENMDNKFVWPDSDSDWFTYCIDIWLSTLLFSLQYLSVYHVLEMTTHLLPNPLLTQNSVYPTLFSSVPPPSPPLPAINNDLSLRALSIRTVKFLNGTQNTWVSDLSDRTI